MTGTASRFRGSMVGRQSGESGIGVESWDVAEALIKETTFGKKKKRKKKRLGVAGKLLGRDSQASAPVENDGA